MKLKTVLAAFAAMVTMGVNAQSWVASEVGTGNFHLYNIGKGQFLTRGNGYQTQASTGFNALTLIVEEYNGNYKLRTDVNGNGYGLERLGDPVIYADQSRSKNSTWTFTKVADAANGPVYTIVSAENHGGGAGSYMTASADNTIVGPASAVTDDYGRWQLVQSWITNTMPVINADGWTTSQNPNAFDPSNICAEFWNQSGASIKQTLTNLPAGSYELIAVALTRTGMTATLNAGTNTMNIATASTSEANNRTQAKDWFNAGNGVNTLEFTHAGGSIEIGLTADNANGDHWLVWRSFVLLYKGLDLSELKAALQAQIDAVPALQGTTTTAAYNAAKNYADGIDMDALTTEEQISNASTELSNFVDAAKALQASYSRFKAIKDAALAISAAVVVPDVESATTTAAIDEAIPTLRANFLAELPKLTVPAEGIDVTSVMVDNAGVHTNTDYWTAIENGSAKTGGSWAVCNYGECEFYNNNFKFYQTLALTPGTWEFGVTGFHRAGNHSTYFYAGEDKILIPGVASTVVNTMAQAQTYFDNGNGKVALKFLIETAGNVEIGIDNQDTQTDKWTIFRDFTLKYYGAPDYSVYEQEWTNAVAAAEAAKSASANANVTGDELTAVNDAIADSPAGSNNKATYVAKINALNDATQAFNAAAPSYDAYVAYKNETIALWGSDLNVAAPTTAAGAVDAVHALNVAQYNKVASDYTFSATGLIGDFGTWEGTATVAGNPATPNYLETEHWSGTTHAYYEQASTGWDNANGWTIKYEKKCTLPAGSYVIKVAARSSVDVTSSISCSATTTTISLPTEGAYARGIKLNGEAGWDGENSEYARNGEGFGWQWRFLPFELTTESEVTMTFYAETSKQYNWMSIADGELLSTTKLAEDVAYNEDDNNTIENKIIADVTMTRNIKAGYNTVVLPFTLTANQVTTAFGAGTEVYAFSENSADPNDVTINFNKGDGSITANVPVLVKATAASSAQTFEGVQVVEPTTGAIVEGTNTKFIGVFGPLTITAGDYFVGNGAIYKSEGSTNIKAFRAYIYAQEASSVKMYIGGIETAISEINADAAAEEQGAIFNLAGQRVNKAQKGIYIQNGKKVLVK